MEHHNSSLRLLLLTALISSTMVQEAWSWRLIGGEPAAPGQFPFMVLLRFPRYFCSGTIVSESWALTAAHCFLNNYTMPFLMAGSVNPLKDQPIDEIRIVERYIIHPEYTKISEGIDYSNHDICLLQVNKPFVWNQYVSPIPLSNSMAVFKPEECMMIGFGSRDMENPLSKIAELYYMKVRSDVRPCLELVTSEREKDVFKDHHLCFTGVLGKDHMYWGDSGSPLVCRDLQFGVASMVLPLLRSDISLLSVYTSIPHFYDWIKKYAFSSSGVFL